MRILIIANTRFKGGLSGSDAIYENFVKHWGCQFTVWSMQNIDFKPFSLCYLVRIILSCFMATFERNKFDVVYSSSDFLPDSLAGFIFKLRGYKWVAGFYLNAFKENKIHRLTQKIVKWLIRSWADMVIVTNPTMYPIFHHMKKTWINGGIDLSLAGLSDEPKIYDAVFCGRIHPSKGIDELLEIWDLVRQKLPKARLALIGDGDLGVDYVRHKLFAKHGRNQYNGIDLLGYMGDERFKVYKQSKVVLYPTPLKYDHFSMAPIEAMACGCVLVAFDTPVIDKMLSKNCGALVVENVKDFDNCIRWWLQDANSWMAENSPLAFEWSKQFDYKKQSTRVYEEICRQLTLT